MRHLKAAINVVVVVVVGGGGGGGVAVAVVVAAAVIFIFTANFQAKSLSQDNENFESLDFVMQRALLT